jgi:hypothetical protein
LTGYLVVLIPILIILGIGWILHFLRALPKDLREIGESYRKFRSSTTDYMRGRFREEEEWRRFVQDCRVEFVTNLVTFIAFWVVSFAIIAILVWVFTPIINRILRYI